MFGYSFGYSRDIMLPLTLPTRADILAAYTSGPEAVVALFEHQQQVLLALAERVEALEARLASLSKDSHNSGKPPSSDGLSKPPAQKTRKTKSLRPSSQQTGRNPGGQAGHSGSTLPFSPSPEHLVEHRPCACSGCGGSLEAVPTTTDGYQRRQVFDLPPRPLRLLITEHRALRTVCPHCGSINEGAFPAHVSEPVQYGPGVAALCTYLQQYQLLPFERTAQLLEDLFGSAPSAGTLSGFLSTCHRRLAPVEEAIRQALVAGKLAHFDETGMRVAGATDWLHVASTERLTYYAHHRKRGRQAMDAIGILPPYEGVAVHDCLASYLGYSSCSHALCNAHLLRELIFIHEQTGQSWAKRLMRLLLLAKRAAAWAATAEAAGSLWSVAPTVCTRLQHCFQALVARGLSLNPLAPRRTGKKRGPAKQSAARKLLERLDKHREAYLAFLFDSAVPFDNNLAERDLRMMKVRQKVSGCFRSAEGASMFCRIRGYISTLRKQGCHLLSALQSVFEGQPLMPALQA